MDTGAAERWESGPTLLDSIWRYRLVVGAVAVICGISGIVLALLQGARYEATAQMVLANPGTVGVFRQELGRPDVDMRQYRDSQLAVMNSTLIAERAANILGPGITAADVQGRVRAEAVGDASVIAVHATDATAERAAALVSAVVDAFTQHLAEVVQARTQLAVEGLQRASTALRRRMNELDPVERDVAVQRLAALENRADQAQVDAAVFGSGLEFLDSAAAPTASAVPVRYGLAGAILGLLTATAFAFWRGERDVEDERDLTAVIGAPLLGEIPEFNGTHARAPVPTVTDRASLTAKAYLLLATSLRFALEEHGGNTVLITSPVPGDGKTVTALNVAIAAGQKGHEILLIDGDQRKRGLSRLCDMADRPGLTDIAVRQLSVEEAVTECVLTDSPTPRTVSAGSDIGDVAKFLHTSSFRTAMDQLKQRADLVVVDSPSLSTAADALSIAAQVDGVVIVIRRGTPKDVLQKAREQLDLAGAPLLGYVFNCADTNRFHRDGNRQSVAT